ncbi:MAG: LAGLIDADG family homing endonuclease [Minisyncoccia bacterium]
MPKTLKYNRIKFGRKGLQRKFILDTRRVLGITSTKQANILNIGIRTLTDWSREKYSMSHVSANKLSKLAEISIPKPYKIFDWNEHLSRIGEIGGRNRLAAYGVISLNENYRKEKWQEWWNKVGKNKKTAKGFKTIQKIKIPKTSHKLAEFVGVMLGDGGIAPYHVHITLSSEEKNYILFVSNLIEELFGVKPKKYKLKNAKAVDVVVQRKNLVDYCQSIGLVKGNKVKQQIDVPDWIKINKSFSKACLRGLIDTDGCFYTNSYSVNGKKYSYLKIAFKSASRPLANSVLMLLASFGVSAKIDKKQSDVRIVGIEAVSKYIKEIGSHNIKHLRKIKNSTRVLKL